MSSGSVCLAESSSNLSPLEQDQHVEADDGRTNVGNQVVDMIVTVQASHDWFYRKQNQ